MAAHVLLVSPIPSHPQDQGNSARIYSIGRMLQSAGMNVHFLYYQLEGLSSDQHRDMARCWDYFHTVPAIPMDMRPTGPDHYGLDDWWPPIVGEIALQLHRRWRFQAVIANYVWFSGVFEVFGSDVIKILDAHDSFGGRAERFRTAGLIPEWYFTSAEEESRGLRRADIVLAIQDEEASIFRSLGHSDVRVLGHLLRCRARRQHPPREGKIRAGYLASGNPLNVLSFERMRASLSAIDLSEVQLTVAGSICRKLPAVESPFRAVGQIRHLDEFYDHVDVVLNPMVPGTGLKIKSVEAVFEGLPLIATQDGTTGLPVKHEFHLAASPEEVGQIVAGLKPAMLPDLAEASRQCALEYAASVRAASAGLVRSVTGPS